MRILAFWVYQKPTFCKHDSESEALMLKPWLTFLKPSSLNLKLSSTALRFYVLLHNLQPKNLVFNLEVVGFRTRRLGAYGLKNLNVSVVAFFVLRGAAFRWTSIFAECQVVVSFFSQGLRALSQHQYMKHQMEILSPQATTA